MNLELKAKTVIICAASAGLGRAAAIEFAREGAQVMLASRRESELKKVIAEIESLGCGEAAFAVTDLTKPKDVEKLVAQTVDRFGGVYTLVNNGGGPPAGLFDTLDDTAWQAAFELNLMSYIRTIRAVLPHMRKEGGGRIVNYSSSSVKAPLDNLILSNTFRMGVLGLTKTLATELAKDGILINVQAPGRIQTDRIEQLDRMRATKAGTTPEQVRSDTCKTIPLGRYGTPAEFAKLTVFLGSPSNTYLTGQTLLLDGGMVKSY